MVADGPAQSGASSSASPVEPPDTEEVPPSTALVLVDRRKARDEQLRVLPRRTSAPFLAQLIATERQLPQTRERRRVTPTFAVAVYGAVARLSARV